MHISFHKIQGDKRLVNVVMVYILLLCIDIQCWKENEKFQIQKILFSNCCNPKGNTRIAIGETCF